MPGWYTRSCLVGELHFSGTKQSMTVNKNFYIYVSLNWQQSLTKRNACRVNSKP